MDQPQSSIWIESLKRESRAKKQWEEKYLSQEQQAQIITNEGDVKPALTLGARRKISERDSNELRLSNLDAEYAELRASSAAQPQSAQSAALQQIRENVARTRPRSHRITQDKSLPSMLGDISPGLWISLNPGYTHASKATMTSSQHLVHKFDPADGWAERVDRTHFMKQDGLMAHADKCYQLGDKPFKSGGMKLNPNALS